MRISVTTIVFLLCVSVSATSAEIESAFSSEELEVARFWEDMGPVLREQGIAAYAKRYHDDFRHWDIQGSGRLGNKESAAKFWGKFHEDGHRITCTYVRPVTVDVFGDISVARLIYEQTDQYADGKESTGLWRMVAVFKRMGDSWQVLGTNLVATEHAADVEEGYHLHCPGEESPHKDL